MRGKKRRTILELQDIILSNTKVTEQACWVWTGKIRPDGYVRFCMNGKGTLAHRISYTVFHGVDISNSPCVMHICDNRACLNPGHLRLGTYADNVRDMFAKGRAFIARGEQSGTSKLTTANVKEIRRLAKTEMYKDIAAKFGVTVYAIGAIVQRKVWKHVA